jgi:ribosome biogenesis GTPase
MKKDLVFSEADASSVAKRVVSVGKIKVTDPVAIADYVEFEDFGDGTGQITKILPRKSKMSRKDAGPRPVEQVVAANIDQVVIFFAVNEEMKNWPMLDWLLAEVEMTQLPVVVMMTKADLAEIEVIEKEASCYRRMEYNLILTSTVNGIGLEKAKEALTGKVSVFVGKSGVGKSSLLNALQPGLGLKVAEISRHIQEGRHTTTHLEMFDLDFGGKIIDTPGWRTINLWNENNWSFDWCYRDFRPYIGKCRFNNCTHSVEPDCAIINAVTEGEILKRRHDSYIKLLDGRQGCQRP